VVIEKILTHLDEKGAAADAAKLPPCRAPPRAPPRRWPNRQPAGDADDSAMVVRRDEKGRLCRLCDVSSDVSLSHPIFRTRTAPPRGPCCRLTSSRTKNRPRCSPNG
jgi:hypothetical protein